MAAAALGESLLRRGGLLRRRFLPSHPAAAATASFPRALHSEEGEDKVEDADDFERRLFGDDVPKSDSGSFFQKLDGVGKPYGRYGVGSGYSRSSRFMNGLGEGFEGFDSLNDGMNEKLDQAARTFVYSEEVEDDDYAFRPDVIFRRGSTYSVRDLDLTKPAAPKNRPRPQFETTTEEVLRKADFRNVRFLANFLTEAGIIIKRSQTRISAKAQRKVAREIKTARAFGLMPFTTMGTKPFIFGRSMQDNPEDLEYYANGSEFRAAEPD